MKSEDQVLRERLVDAMTGRHSHIDFDGVVEDFPAKLRGVKPQGAPHTAWQLLEHLRIAQHDILEFSRNPKYKSPKWPDGYWPKTDAPPDEKAWDTSIAQFQQDAEELRKLLLDPSQNVFRRFEHGDGQNLLRESLLVATHNSYHLGQLVYLKKTLLANP
jgi:hypothetical protein